MNIRKLNWAGIQLECGDKTILIDAVENFKPYLAILGEPLTPPVYFTEEVKADYILFTHLHLDHFDAGVIERCLKADGVIVAHKKFERDILPLGRKYILLDNGESLTANGLMFKPVYSMGGLGESQVAWVVSDGTTTIFHGGDTIWHNRFWQLGRENPGIDYAFLPVNGAVVNFQAMGLEYSSVPASLTPEQAFNAAKLLHARKLIPIHYGQFASPYYQPADTSTEIFEHWATLTGQSYQLLADGDHLI